MRTSVRGAKPATRLRCEQLEDRLTPALAYVLTDTGTLATFDTANPTVSAGLGGAITGVAANETLVGIDVRPGTGQLYALGVNGLTFNGTIYTLNVGVGAVTATVVGTAGSVDAAADLPDPTLPLLLTGGFGFDFNPVIDRIRIVTTAGQSLVINPDTGAVQDERPTLNGGATTADASAYLNNFPGAAGTTLYALDAGTNTLYTQDPTTSVLTAVGVGLGVDFGTVNGFDITPDGTAFAVLTVGATTQLYTINLATGVATAAGAAGAVQARGFAVATGGTVSFQSPTVTGTEGGDGVTVTLTRTGFTGPQTVIVNVTGGTATSGTDFTPGPYTVTFANGATTATLTIPFTSDGIADAGETLNLTIAAVSNGLIGTQNTATITVNDPASVVGQAFGTGSAIPAVGVRTGAGANVNVFQPYGNNYTGGVRVAVGDVNGDGVADLVVVPTIGIPLVRVFSGVDGSEMGSFLAYAAEANIPASIAVGDINNDGFDDIIVGTTTTIPVILVFSGKDFSSLGAFLPFGNAPVGVNVASGDVNDDGFDDIVIGTATGISAVGVFSGQDFSALGLFLPFGSFQVGASVAAGDVDGDGRDDIIVGTTSLVPAVGVFNANGFTQQQLFFPFGGGTGGANVAMSDVNGDGKLDLLVGASLGTASVSVFDPTNLALIETLLPFGGFTGGVFVG